MPRSPVIRLDRRARPARHSPDQPDNPQHLRDGNGSTWARPDRDVVLLEGGAKVLEMDAVCEDVALRYAEHTGWDPRPDESMVWIEFSPRRILAWREVDELEGRAVMDDGRWLV